MLRGILVVAVMALLGCSACGSASLTGTWRAPKELEFYDHLERVTFDGRGHGESVWGWEQNVHFQSRFDYERKGSRVDLTYLDPPARGEKRALSYEIESGKFTFRRTTPVGPQTTVCRRRITFDDTPFPPDTASSKVYFADCELDPSIT